MLVCVSLIYIGGFTCLYLHLLYHALCPAVGPSSQQSENDNQVNVSYNLDGRADWEEYSNVNNILDSDSDIDSSTEISDQELYKPSWEGSTREIETFRRSSQQFEYPITTQPGVPPRSKSVKFAPISREHSTFSGDDYKRKNREYFASMKSYQMNPELIKEVYREIRDFINNEMEVLSQMPRISDPGQKESNTDLIFEMDC